MNVYEAEIWEVDRVTKMVYSGICFKEGDKPKLHKLKRLFIPDGRLINNNDEEPLLTGGIIQK
ncbi:hypothetical protein [Desulfonema magnum]|uniref:Uncharacterized protein n=1 Tax=Desulfonema magnum TaxID=45655 RepID=A0A975BLP7_9BACT|nr:hypothetical protein [Desulfonema magnum]QTA87740.1 Uncharacterized protein dnm_037770 [Desulfonema magnum]